MASRRIVLATQEGLRAMDGSPALDFPLPDAVVTAGAVRGRDVAVIAGERQVWILERGAWRKDASASLRLNCLAWSPDGRLLAGTEGARVGWVRDGDVRWIEAFDRVPERPEWDTPWGGPADVRSLAGSTDGTLYANIHVGWIVASRDHGETWRSLTDGLDKDVHMVAAHPIRPEIVFAATANGFHISSDHGSRFAARTDGMPYHYQHAVACFPDRDVYLASTARHDGGSGASLYRSEDEGRHWIRVDGLPAKLDRNINTHQVGCLDGGRAFVFARDTQLYESIDYGLTWRRVGDDLPAIHAILVV